MENHGYEEAMKMESTIVVKLMKEIDYKNQKLLEMEHKYDETTTTVRKLVVGLTLAINRKDRSLLEMEQKLDESSITVRWLENEKEKLHEEHHKQLEKLKFMNSRLNHDMECLKKEFGQLAKELKDNKVHNELERQGFVDEIEKLKRELQAQKPVDSNSNWKTQIETLNNRVQYLESLAISLSVKESRTNQELQDARKEAIDSLRDMFKGRSQLGIRRMGELDGKPFQDMCSQKYSSEDWQEKSAQLCSLWQEKLSNACWHPFKNDMVNCKEIINDDDEELQELRKEYGEVVYMAVTTALLELNEYNGSGRYAVPEIRNWKEERRANLKEIIQYIIRQLKAHKRKRK